MTHSFRTAEARQLVYASLCQRGFTLIELVMVMVVVGILSVFVAPRLFDANVFRSHGAAEQVKAALRYGQKVAIAQRRTAGLVVTITSAADSNCGAVLNAGGNVDCVISSEVVDPAFSWVVTFDALGRPGAAASMVVGSATVSVEAETGYVH